MNVRDSEFVTGILLDSGFEMAPSAESADAILFNSCSVRKHAENRLFGNIADLKNLKKARPDLVIGLMGCTAQNYKDKIFEKLPIVDIVCGPGNESDLPSLIKEVLKNRCAMVATNKVNEKRRELFPAYRASAFKTYVSISEGCDNYCSYCIVPYVRGKERSRRADDIIKEARSVAEDGCMEITLLGQNVNSYRDRGCGFVKLLEKLNKIDGIERIRFMTSHPKGASNDLFKAMKNLDKVCEHLHLPLQSGSDRILKLMKRGYTSAKYLRLIDAYRELVPEGSVTTDIIVGFPSETEKDFEKTLAMMKDVKFDNAFLFNYSPRPPARSSRIKDDVSKETKGSRFDTLLELQCDISLSNNAPMIGKAAEVLVDGQNRKTSSLVSGRTRTNKTVVFGGAQDLTGKMVDVRIESVTPHALKGRVA